MVLSAYLDESGTHKSADQIIIAGYLSNQKRWRQCEIALAKLFFEKNVKRFHAIDLQNGKGEFKGWSPIKRQSFWNELQRIVNKTAIAGLVAVLQNSDYRTHYLSDKKNGQDSALGVCFRACMSWLSEYAFLNPKQQPLHVIVEGGSRNAGSIQRYFQAFKEALHPGYENLIGDFHFADKPSCRLLATADQLAYLAFRKESELASAVRTTAIAPNENKVIARVIRLEIDRKSLQDLLDNRWKPGMNAWKQNRASKQ